MQGIILLCLAFFMPRSFFKLNIENQKYGLQFIITYVIFYSSRTRVDIFAVAFWVNKKW